MGNSSSADWISLEEIRRRTPLGRKAILSLARRGQIGVLRIEGLPDKFNARDIAELIAAGIRPAKAKASRELVEAR